MSYTIYCEPVGADDDLDMIITELRTKTTSCTLDRLFGIAEQKMEDMEKDLKAIEYLLDVSLDQAKTGHFRHLDYVIKCVGWVLESIMEISEPLATLQKCVSLINSRVLQNISLKKSQRKLMEMEAFLDAAEHYVKSAEWLSGFAEIQSNSTSVIAWNLLGLDSSVKAVMLLQKAHEYVV